MQSYLLGNFSTVLMWWLQRRMIAEREAGGPPLNTRWFMTPPDLRRSNRHMRTRFKFVINRLLPLGTLDSLQEALDHIEIMSDKSLVDELGQHNHIPHLVMLRLDRDQEAFESVLWWKLDSGLQPDIYSTPVFDEHTMTFMELDSLACMLLLKLKLVVDINNLKIARKAIGPYGLPTELRDQIEEYIIRSPLSLKTQRQNTEFLYEMGAKLLKHICILGSKIDEFNPGFIANLLRPIVSIHPGWSMVKAPRGSWLEVQRVMKYSYVAWETTDGVLGLLKHAYSRAEYELEQKVDMIMMNRGDIIAGRSRAELLTDASRNAIWDYLPLIVDDAAYLGCPSSRSAERKEREVEVRNLWWVRETWRVRKTIFNKEDRPCWQ
ncbi:hypothetical protein F5Y18DRAFT_389597 [Xylariaceae sp. FL1019]|nr:hypothetical protein F5Y18DRAFT_389597 [Xylariaceae sp. FL1019]